MNALVTTSTSNAKISVGLANNVYVAIANTGVLAGLFRSGNGGTSWTSLDLPSPTVHPGGQASIRLSLVALKLELANPKTAGNLSI